MEFKMADGILVVCGCFPPAFEKEYFENSIGLPQIAADKLQKNIILGIKEVTGQKTEWFAAPFIGLSHRLQKSPDQGGYRTGRYRRLSDYRLFEHKRHRNIYQINKDFESNIKMV